MAVSRFLSLSLDCADVDARRLSAHARKRSASPAVARAIATVSRCGRGGNTRSRASTVLPILPANGPRAMGTRRARTVNHPPTEWRQDVDQMLTDVDLEPCAKTARVATNTEAGSNVVSRGIAEILEMLTNVDRPTAPLPMVIYEERATRAGLDAKAPPCRRAGRVQNALLSRQAGIVGNMFPGSAVAALLAAKAPRPRRFRVPARGLSADRPKLSPC